MSLAKIVATLVERGEEELAEELLAVGAPKDSSVFADPAKLMKNYTKLYDKAIADANALVAGLQKELKSHKRLHPGVFEKAAGDIQSATMFADNWKKTLVKLKEGVGRFVGPRMRY